MLYVVRIMLCCCYSANNLEMEKTWELMNFSIKKFSKNLIPRYIWELENWNINSLLERV